MESIMNPIRLSSVDDFGDKNLRSFRILGRHVGVFREADGSFRAMEIGCRHQNADLSKGLIKDHVVTCTWHGWQYDLRTGECLRGGTSRLRHYTCTVENGFIYISAQPVESAQPSAAVEDGDFF
jgi:nitrite reductase/ring-hydroxylating ferredoxin subunit